MYFKYTQEKYCCNCDWLSFSVLTHEIDPEIICPDGLRLELCQGNNVFEHRALVYDGRGAKYLTLLWKPYSSVLPPNLMTCQVANEFLYFSSGMGIKWAWGDVQKIVDCTFNAVGRFDVCLDWESSEKRTEFLRHLNSNHIYAQRKSEGSVWWHSIQNDHGHKKQLHCLSWGSKSSEIKVKIYHKSREQGLLAPPYEPEKPWIVEEWKEAGLNISNVWRLEFSFAGAGQLRWQGEVITLDMIADERWLLEVLCQCYESRFVTRLNQGKRLGHHNEDERVYLLQLPKAASALKWAEPKMQDHEIPASITLLRSMMRQLENPCITCHKPTFESYASSILQIIRDHKLHGYFVRTYQADPEEYFNELWQNVGTGIHYISPSPARLMD